MSDWAWDDEADAVRAAQYAAEEEEILRQLSPDVLDLPEGTTCGGCGAGDLGARPVIRASFREGEPPWVRCTECRAAWLAERRREGALDRAELARSLPTIDWRWIRAKFDGWCVLCGVEIVEGERCSYIAEARALSCPSCWGRTRYEQGARTRRQRRRKLAAGRT